MNKMHTLEALQRAAAHLLLTAEDAPVELAAEMRHVAARLQALSASHYFGEWQPMHETLYSATR